MKIGLDNVHINRVMCPLPVLLGLSKILFMIWLLPLSGLSVLTFNLIKYKF